MESCEGLNIWKCEFIVKLELGLVYDRIVEWFVEEGVGFADMCSGNVGSEVGIRVSV